jgi:hypothetical protein
MIPAWESEYCEESTKGGYAAPTALGEARPVKVNEVEDGCPNSSNRNAWPFEPQTVALLEVKNDPVSTNCAEAPHLEFKPDRLVSCMFQAVLTKLLHHRLL